ncbi:MAG: hypothetical protein P8100_10960 [bacterium]|jgi:hypothetical protein
MSSRTNYQISLLASILLMLTLNSCSLLNFESAEPLSKKDINTRYRVQSYAGEVLQRNETALDSIMILAEGQQMIQLQALRWKVNMTSRLKKISFQTIPKVALTDTWAYLLSVRNFLSQEDDKQIFGPYQYVLLAAAEENVKGIESIANNLMNENEFLRYKEFVNKYAEENPLTLKNELQYQTIREAYLAFEEIPDSAAIETVGTLPQVVSNLAGNIDFTSEITGKKLAWQTEIFLKERGLDSISLETRLEQFEIELNRLATVAEESPEILSEAIEDFRQRMYPLFSDLNTEIELAVEGLSHQMRVLDTMVLRERIALDSIILREREAISRDAKEIADTGIKNAFAEIHAMIKTILFYLVLILIIILGIPFYLGYLTGKRKGKLKKEME